MLPAETESTVAPASALSSSTAFWDSAMRRLWIWISRGRRASSSRQTAVPTRPYPPSTRIFRFSMFKAPISFKMSGIADVAGR